MSQVFREADSGTPFAEALRGLAEVYAAQSQLTVRVVNPFLGQLAAIFVVATAGSTMLALLLPLIKLLKDLA